MKKVFSLLLALMLGMFVFCSCSEDDPVPQPEPPVNLNTLAGREWTLHEDGVVSVFNFIDDKNMTVTETSTSASLRMTRAGVQTYTGTYTYNSEAKTAEFKYNNRTRALTDIQFGEGTVSFKIDGKAVTASEEKEEPQPSEVANDKEFLEKTGQEFVGLFTAEQAAPYTSIINVIKESRTKEIDEEIDDIIDGLTSQIGYNPNVYKYAIKAAKFQGRYVLRNGTWYKESASGHTAEFTDDMGRQCKLTVTTSGATKNVIIYEDEDYRFTYDQYGNFTGAEEELYYYEAELPSHINCVLTQGGNTLINVVLDINLGNLSDGQKINLDRNSFSFTCTADFAGVARVNVSKASYQAGGTSEANFNIEKNGRKILTASATAQGSLPGVAPYELDEDDFDNVTSAFLNLNILDKVQIKGFCSNVGSLIEALDKAGDYDNYTNEQVVRQYVNQANTLLDAKVYYNNTSQVRATLKFDVDQEEDYEYSYNYNTGQWFPVRSYNTYNPTTSIVFSDDSSYFIESYFTKDAFRDLVNMFNDLTDKVENQVK